MAGEKLYKTGAGDDEERAIVAEMLRNPDSEHWDTCYKYVTKQVCKRTKGMHADNQEDIIQEVMEKTAIHLSSFRFESALRSWLNSITQRCITDRYRKFGVQRKYLSSIPNLDDEKDEDNLAIPGKSTEEIFEAKEQMSDFVKALVEYAEKHKSRRDKLILKLFIEDEFSQAEIAKRAGCTPTTVSNVIHAAQRYAQGKMNQADGMDGGK